MHVYIPHVKDIKVSSSDTADTYRHVRACTNTHTHKHVYIYIYIYICTHIHTHFEQRVYETNIHESTDTADKYTPVHSHGIHIRITYTYMHTHTYTLNSMCINKHAREHRYT